MIKIENKYVRYIFCVMLFFLGRIVISYLFDLFRNSSRMYSGADFLEFLGFAIVMAIIFEPKIKLKEKK